MCILERASRAFVASRRAVAAVHSVGFTRQRNFSHARPSVRRMSPFAKTAILCPVKKRPNEAFNMALNRPSELRAGRSDGAAVPGEEEEAGGAAF